MIDRTSVGQRLAAIVRTFVLRRAIRYGMAVGVAVGAFVGARLFGLWSEPATFALFLTAVVLASWFGGLGPGLVATLLSVPAAAWVIDPPYSLAVDDLWGFVVFVGSAVLIAWLTASRTSAERGRSETEERLQGIIDSAMDAIISIDDAQRVRLFNAAAERMFGCPVTEAIGAPIERFIPGRFRLTRHAHVETVSPTTGAMSRGSGSQRSLVGVRSDGQEFPVEATISQVEVAAPGVYTVILRDVTERHRAEAEREHLLKERMALLDSTADGVFGVDPEGRCTFINRAAAEMLGYEPDEVIGREMHALSHSRHADGSPYPGDQCPIYEAVTTGQVRRVDGEVVWRRNGTAVPVEYAAAPIVVGGVTEGAVVTLRDVSDRRRADERLRFLAEASTVLGASLDYQATLKSLARLVVPYLADYCTIDLADANGRIRRVASAHVDPSREPLLRATHGHPPEPSVRQMVGRALEAGRAVTITRLEVPDNDLHRTLGLTSCMAVPFIAHGRTLGAISFAAAESGRRYGTVDLALAEDVAHRAALAIDNARLFADSEARRRAAESLSEVSQALAETLDPEAVARRIVDSVRALLDARMSVLYRVEPRTGDLEVVAVSGERLQSFPRGLVLSEGTGVAGLAARRRSPVASSDLFEDSRLTLPGDVRRRIDDAEYRAAVAVPLRVQDRVIGVLGVGDHVGRVFDADEIRLAQLLGDQAALALENSSLYGRESAARAEAETANRAKDHFLATLSHELRTPLSAMLGWVGLLRSGKLDVTTTGRALETIERNTLLQTKLIDDLLDVSRIISGKLRLDIRRVDLARVVSDAVNALRPAADAKSITLTAILESARCLVDGDPDRLQQIVWNLLSNAIKFTPEGGRVEARLDLATGRARITVHDTGVGIAAELLPHIFDRFRQADSTSTRSHGGLGLGLAIVRHLTERHGGVVRATSDGPGHGASFTVELPLAAPAGEREPGQRAARAVRAHETFGYPPVLDNVRILVVDDEPDARELVMTILSQCKADVTVVPSAAAGLSALTRLVPDILVSDIGMPGEDGYELIRRIRALPAARGGQIPAVALTAYASGDDRERALAAGYHAHVAKPVDPGTLVEVVAALAGRSASD